MKEPPRRCRMIIATGVVWAILAAALGARWVALTSAGAMWRDEAHSVQMAADHAKAVYNNDSFPLLWLGTLRTWMMVVGPAADDFAIRVWGATTGVLLVCAAMWAPRLRRADFPAWAGAALLALHPVVVVFGGETRGYALGAACALLMSGCVARILFLGETTWRYLWAVLAALAAVQASYTNSPVCAGVVGAGVLLQVWRRRPAAALRLFAVGLIAAASMVPYAQVASATNSWAVIVKGPYGFPHYLAKVWEALAQAGTATAIVWLIGTGAVVATAVVRGTRLNGGNQLEGRSESEAAPALPLEDFERSAYATLVLVLGTASVLVYHRFLSVPTQVWYQIPILALWAFAIDLVAPQWQRSANARSAALIVALVVAAWNSWLVCDAARMRMTNIDLVAKLIGEKATADDLVVVRPFYYGISFGRYYRGPAPWITLPEIPVAELPYGYGYFKAAMSTDEQIDGSLDRISRHLASGGRLWLVADVQPLGRREDPGRLPPAPTSPYGWSEGAYEFVWSRQLTDVLQRNAAAIVRYDPGVDYPINPFEHQPVFEVRGRNVPSDPSDALDAGS